MKKSLSFLMFIVLLFSFSLITTKASELVIGAITDDTTIAADLKQIDVEYGDYFTIENTEYNYKNYFEYFVIAVAENRIEASKTNVYIYVYNPIYIENVAINIDMTINNDFKVTSDYLTNTPGDFTLCSRSENNILKLKYEYNNFYPDRNYTILVKDIESGITSHKFIASLTTSDDGKLLETEYNFNSMLYIEEDKFIELEFEDWNTASWWESICHEFNLFKDEEKVLMYFYNFNTSKTIDKILEVDFKYDHYNYISTAYYDPKTGDHLRELSSSRSDEVKGYEVTKYPGTKKQSVYGTECTFNAFTTPASNRLNEFGDSISVGSSLFDYDHSVLVDINKSVEVYSTLKTVPKKEVFPFYDDNVYSTRAFFETTQVLEKKINAYKIENLKMTRLKYKAGGKTFNSYVLDDLDDPIHVDPDNPKAEESAWEKFVKWFMDNFPFSLILVIGIPIVLIVIAVFCPHIYSLILNYIVAAGQFAIKVITWIVKSIINVITLPFRLIIKVIKKIFKRE